MFVWCEETKTSRHFLVFNFTGLLVLEAIENRLILALKVILLDRLQGNICSVIQEP